MNITKGRIHSIETLGTLDGPGVRVVVFLQGCPLRCGYCHNPDTWDINEGKTMSARDVIDTVSKYKKYFSGTGGVTFSGGEPFMQSGFLLTLLKLSKEKNIHTAVDTSGFFLDDTVKECLKYTDLVLLDIKHWDNTKHKILTGVPLKNTLQFLDYITSQKIPYWVRHVIIKGYNDTCRDMDKIVGLLKRYRMPEKIELLPFHLLGKGKWKMKKIEYEFYKDNIPEDKKVKRLQKYVVEKSQ